MRIYTQYNTSRPGKAGGGEFAHAHTYIGVRGGFTTSSGASNIQKNERQQNIKMHFVVVAAIVVACIVGLASCQRDCAFPTDDNVESVISLIFPTADSPTTPAVNVLEFQPLCLAHSQQRNRYRYFSVLVRYTCAGNANCPPGTALEQIDSQCINGEWSNSVQGSIVNSRRTDPTATLSTTTREDCQFCFSTDLAGTLSLTTDDVTHCVGE